MSFDKYTFFTELTTVLSHNSQLLDKFNKVRLVKSNFYETFIIEFKRVKSFDPIF